MAINGDVMIVDESPNRRNELKRFLAELSIRLAAESGYGVSAVSLVEERKPAIVLASVEQPVSRAIQTIESIHAASPETKIVVYSSNTTVDVVRQAMRAGAIDYLPRPLKLEQVHKAIGDALGGADGPAAEDTVTPGAGTVVTVIGAKGGIGKTTIAINLATAIARQGDNSVLIIDLDTRFGDVAIMMDVEPRYVAADIAASIGTINRDTFREALVKHESGVFILPSAKSPNQWRTIEPEQVKELVRFAARLFDYVIIDTPGLFGDVVGAAIEVANQVLLITTVDITSVKDTTFVLDLLERDGFPTEKLQVMVNHANGSNTITSADVSRVLHTDVSWEIPFDPAVSVGLQAGKPVVLGHPKSAAATNFAEMAAKLTGVEPPKKDRGILLRRMLPVRGQRN